MSSVGKNLVLLLTTLFVSCVTNKEEQFIKQNVNLVCQQTLRMLDEIKVPTGENYPRTMDDKGELMTTGIYDWTPGFFPGSLWYLYELTGDTLWRSHAEKWTIPLEPLKTFTGHHDLGFMMYCSYGNANRLHPKENYKDIIIESANSLSSRFSDVTQTIKSWDFNNIGWDGTVWGYPVIIDNMMNLELLLAAAKLSGDKRYYDIAIKHANSTMRDFFREDYSTYHIVDYDTITGVVKDQATYQGYSNNSMWSRGQAWAIYGFTMMFRETKKQNYLTTAVKAVDLYLDRLPEDMIPFWDFNVGEEGYIPGHNSYAAEFPLELKDASAGAIVCSALFELYEYTNNKKYLDSAIRILHNLSSLEYQARSGENANFVIKHCVGSLPHKAEIDKPLVYADYYYLEALLRYKKYLEKK